MVFALIAQCKLRSLALSCPISGDMGHTAIGHRAVCHSHSGHLQFADPIHRILHIRWGELSFRSERDSEVDLAPVLL